MKERKKLGLDEILGLIKEGKNPAQICKKYNIPKQTLSYSLNKLKNLGCAKRIGYGVWEYIKEVPIRPIDTKKGKSDFKQIRGHAFIWKIEFIKNFDWESVINKYKGKLKFQYMNHNKIFRVIFNNRKIWLTKKGMIIYEPIDFIGNSSFEVKGKAVYEMDSLIKELLIKLNLKFVQYRFTTSREHYGIIKNELARQYNDRKEKMNIRSEDGTLWLWIDDSLSLGELENNEAKTNRELQNFWNDHKKHKFEVTPSFVLNGFNQLNNIQVENNKQLLAYAEQNKEHLKVIQEYRKESIENRKLINELLKRINS